MLVSEIIALVFIFFLLLYPAIFFCASSTVPKVLSFVSIFLILCALGILQHKINAKRLLAMEKQLEFWEDCKHSTDDVLIQELYNEKFLECEEKFRQFKKKISSEDAIEYKKLKEKEIESSLTENN